MEATLKAFIARWRSARQHREFEVFAEESVGATLYRALVASEGLEAWQSGTVWRCPGCFDCTIRTEEFLEGLRRAERALFTETSEEARIALEWMERTNLTLMGCERDRVYIKDASNPCRYGGERFTSRI